MAKKNTRTSTHFEQLPIAEVVKRIVPDGASEARKDGSNGQTAIRPPQPATGSKRFHGVQFYNDPDGLCRIVGGFVGEGLEQGALAVIIATPEHAARIESRLRDRGIDVDELKRYGSLVTFDARDTLQLFMSNGMPNPGAFRRAITAALTGVRDGREHCAIRAYGEMVDLLWKDGLETAAIRLETLWNQFANTYDFELLCGYSIGNFYKGSALAAIHNQHSHLGRAIA